MLNLPARMNLSDGFQYPIYMEKKRIILFRNGLKPFPTYCSGRLVGNGFKPFLTIALQLKKRCIFTL
jgi:hypothetical protein